MSPRSPFPTNRHSRSGVALIVVLSFVLLLTVLAVAFFSRALSERQISNSSVNLVKADMLAQGAANTVIGDLQQEIAAGSSPCPLPSPAPAQGSATIFAPNSAATMVPAQVLPSALPSPPSVSGLENLVKQSVGGRNFYPDPNAPTTASYYNTNVFPPSARAAKSVSGNGASGDNNSARASLNGRYISAARWNKPLLLPATLPTDATYPAPPASVGFVPPDWVLVARDGSNPGAWNDNLKTSATGTTSVVGRFAYNIYDEGGLLDANAAGYPAPSSTPSPNLTPDKMGKYGPYKNVLAYADLTQLRDASGTQLLTQTQIDALVGWRNNASAQVTGPFPSPAFSDSSRDSYYKFLVANTTGFLTLGSAPLSGNKQSDRMFAGRQNLIDFMQSMATLMKSDVTPINASLCYLGTFSRGLEQPSFMKVQSLDQKVPGYDATAPAVLALASGGNNAGPDGGNPGLDSAINPSFLNVRVPSSATGKMRYDGSPFVAGEPLVKKRFNLSRLAWLTFAGPIADDSGKLNPTGNSQVATIISNLETYYGFSEAFLKQGGPTNIYNYFGLKWDVFPSTDGSPVLPPSGTKCWVYSGHNRSGATGAICKLNYPSDASDVVRQNREADFFELLKASINVGSIAKTATPPPADFVNPATVIINKAYTDQYKNDYRVDDAIIQIGANIIDQFDQDTYPTHIFFNDGSGTAGGRQFYGDEDLPYFSGVEHALVKVKQADKNSDGSVKDTGVGVLLQCPKLWNPHDYNPTPAVPAIPAPTKFRIWAETQNGDTFRVISINTGGNNSQVTTNTGQAASPGWTNRGFTWAPAPKVLTQTNTLLAFSGGNTNFREPTVLFQPGSVTSSPDKSNFDAIGINSGFFIGNGFISAVDSGTANVPPTVASSYIGFYLGAVPLFWQYDNTGTRRATHRVAFVDPPGTILHYFLQYQDANGNWATYDQQNQNWGGQAGSGYNISAESSGLSSGGSEFSASTPPTDNWRGFLHSSMTYDSGGEYIDPRTGRFHYVRTWLAPNSANAICQHPAAWSYPPFAPGAGLQWLNMAQGITTSLRYGPTSGIAAPTLGSNFFPPGIGWYPGTWNGEPGQPGATYADANGVKFRPGWLSQNNPAAASLAGENAPAGEPTTPQYYADPDGVVRRAMGGLVPSGSQVGLPLATAFGANGVSRSYGQSVSRPILLNRPFRAVGELGYTFTGTPWKNLDFNVPESGDAALLDVFCVSDTDNAGGLVAGKVNLNTRQAPVLQAIIAGAYKDEFNVGTSSIDGGSSTSTAGKAATALVVRTTNLQTTSKGPLRNVSELAGKWVTKQTLSGGGIDPKSYDGYSADLWNGTSGALSAGTDANVGRYQAAAVRALASSGQTRVWNLMIDVIAQTGRYPQTATGLDKFLVEGEQRYWVHIAIDRFTGNVIDKQIEVVKE